MKLKRTLELRMLHWIKALLVCHENEHPTSSSAAAWIKVFESSIVLPAASRHSSADIATAATFIAHRDVPNCDAGNRGGVLAIDTSGHFPAS